MTQCKRLLDHLRHTITPLTPLDSWRALGIYRLGARVFDLRKQGWNVQKKTVTVYNSWGEPCKVAGYYLDPGADSEAPTLNAQAQAPDNSGDWTIQV